MDKSLYIFKCLKSITKRKDNKYELLISDDMLIESEGMRGIEKSAALQKMKHYDWWTKYYASKEHINYEKMDAQEKRKLKYVIKDRYVQDLMFEIYGNELEAQPEFNGFNDCFYTFPISQKKKGPGQDEKIIVAHVKAKVILYSWPVKKDAITTKGKAIDNGGILRHERQSNEPISILLRVYVVQGYELHPHAHDTLKPNSYIVISTPLQSIGDSSSHIKQETNPCFGKNFEMEVDFPLEFELTVKVMNYDPIRKNEVIGQTKIDLENRYYSKHRARCGLQSKYERSGFNKWRDQWQPSEILQNLCYTNNINEPKYLGKGVFVGGKYFPGATGNKEGLALNALLQWEKIPIVGCKLVREHVETRILYHPNYPGVPKGSLEMWIDMFEMSGTAPPPMVPLTDITPRVPAEYELRVTILNVQKVQLRRASIFLARKHADVFIRGWVLGDSDRQETDVHFRSFGEALFNWRFVFRFFYLAAEQAIITNYKKPNYFKIKGEVPPSKIPARLYIQVWDKERVKQDFFIGSTSFDLPNMPRGKKYWWRLQLSRDPNKLSKNVINLFDVSEHRGWWPMYGSHKFDEKNENVGYIEMDFKLLTKEQADRYPVGHGRSYPDPLEAPDRKKLQGSCSIYVIMSPFRYFYAFIYRHKWKTALVIGTIVSVLFGALALYAVPGYTVKKILGA